MFRICRISYSERSLKNGQSTRLDTLQARLNEIEVRLQHIETKINSGRRDLVTDPLFEQPEEDSENENQ